MEKIRPRLLTQAEAAKRLGVSPAAICNAVARGTLRHQEVAEGMKLIDPMELLRYALWVQKRYPYQFRKRRAKRNQESTTE